MAAACGNGNRACGTLPPDVVFTGQAIAKHGTTITYRVGGVSPVRGSNPISIPKPGETVEITYDAGARYIKVGKPYRVPGFARGDTLFSSVKFAGGCGRGTVHADGS